MADDYITVVEVDDPTSKDTNPMQQLVKRQSSIPEDSSFITVLTINNHNYHHNNNNNSNNNNINEENINHSSKEMNSENDIDLRKNVLNSFTNTTTTTTATTTTTTPNSNVANNSNHNTNIIKSSTELETVIIYRLPGELLGFGLKFQGGTQSTEKVQKLFIQSCVKDSPASKVATSWGLLREGDEIVCIDSKKVSDLTRIECVDALKDNVVIMLEVRNGNGQNIITTEDEEDLSEEQQRRKIVVDNENIQNGNNIFVGSKTSTLKPPPPPPVPPRKLVKRNSLKEQSFTTTDAAASALNSLDSNNGMLNKPFTPPPDAEYYINLFADDQSLKTESESDDTASTISTVIDKFSLTSSYSSETDLSSYASLTNGGTDLTKVLKPFTMLEQEFKVVSNTTKPINNIIPGNNYENVDFKTEKINAYENMEFTTNGECVPKQLEIVTVTTTTTQTTAIPTPKPRQVNAIASSTTTSTTTTSTTTTTTATIEPKKRSILPLPRKLTGSPMKLPIEVAPPKVPETLKLHNNTMEAITPINEFIKTPTPTTTTTTTTTPATTLTPSKEFITKIPKAIASVFSPNSQRSMMERAKTESEIKLSIRQHMSPSALMQQTALFLEAENKVSTLPNSPTIQQSTTTTSKASPLMSNALKSRIPVVATPPKRTADCDEPISTSNIGSTEKKSILTNFQHAGSPSNIPRMLMQKQKSETDLKLGQQYRSKSKENSPTMLNMKVPLMRTISAESKLRTPERTLIPVLSGSTTFSSSTESLSASSTTSSSISISNGKPKGPKPKPPERIQSLTKQPTQIPKLQQQHQQQQQQNSTPTTPPTPVLTSQPQSHPHHHHHHHNHHHHYSPTQIPTMQTFKQQTTPSKSLPAATPARGIRFKIQTYESKAQATTNNAAIDNGFTDVNANKAEIMPSLFDLMHKGKQHESQNKEYQDFNLNLDLNSHQPIKIHVKDMIDDNVPMLDRETPPPMVIGKCIKLSDDDGEQATYYSSSSSEDDGEESVVDDAGKDYDCEDGEKLGPPEVINGPGPSEAYFNLYWLSNMLPTIGEVAEEELSSLEQSLSNGPIVIVDDLSQQNSPVSSEKKIVKATSTKSKKAQFIGVPVLPPTVPNMDLEKNLQQATSTKVDSTEKNAVQNSPQIDVVSCKKSIVDDADDDIDVDVDDEDDKTKQEIMKINIVESTENNNIDSIKTTDEVNEILNDKIVDMNQTKPNNNSEITNDLKSQTTLLTKMKCSKSTTEKDAQQEQQLETTVTKIKSSESVTQELQQEEAEEALVTSTAELENTIAATKHIKKTTKKKVIKTTTTSSSSSSSTTLSTYNNNNNVETAVDVDEEKGDRKLVNELTNNNNELKHITNNETTNTSNSSNTEITSPTIAFTLQPYTERHTEKPKITVMEERQYECAEQAFKQIRTRNIDGDEQLQQSNETHRERANLKKIHSTDSELLATYNDNEIEPLTTTAATAETRITELVKDPQDKQSIEGGILHLSESGKQFERNKAGELIGLIECEHQVLDTYEDLQLQQQQQTATKNETEKPFTLLREVSECLTLTKDDEKQVTKRAETTMSQLPATSSSATSTQPTTPKKVATLLKKTEDEKRLEREARELIENYQKVKKEAEKLFQDDSITHNVDDDDNGFDLDDIESTEQIPSNVANGLHEFLTAERSHALKPNDEIQQNHQQYVENEVNDADNALSISVTVASNLPPALPTSAIPDLLIETEPLYVLHKNIIDETPPPSTKSTATEPIPQRRNFVNNEKQQQQIRAKAPMTITSKPATTISSVDSVDHATATLTNINEIRSPVETIERIIVGVEHQLELPMKMTAPTKATNTKTIDQSSTTTTTTQCVGGDTTTTMTTSNGVSNSNNDIAIVSSNCTVIGTTITTNPTLKSNSFQLESINLPNLITAAGTTTTITTPIQTPTIMSTSSSADSVQSVVGNVVHMNAAAATLEHFNDIDDLLLAANEEDVPLKTKMDDNGTSSLVLQSSTTTHGAAPPPAYSRLPPDGHEFPPNFCEPADIGLLSIKHQLSNNHNNNNKNGNSLSKNKNKNSNSTTTTEAAEMELHMEKSKHSFVDNISSNNNKSAIITTTTAIATTNINNNNNNTNSRTIKPSTSISSSSPNANNNNENSVPSSIPPPLPKTVPPPPVTKPRKIFREKLVVSIEDARELNSTSLEAEVASTNSTPPTMKISSNAADAIVLPRRSSSTQSLSAIATTTATATSSSGGSTPTAHKLDQPDFQLRDQSKRSWAARKPSDWHKDEKSERSVRDKIAMFSMDDSGSSMSGSTPHLNLNLSLNSACGSGSGSSSRKSLNWSSENLLETNSANSRMSAFPTPPSVGAVGSVVSSSNSNSNRNITGGDYFGRTTNDIFTTRALSMENLYAAPCSNNGVDGKQQQQQELSKYSESLQSLHTMPSYYASLPRRHVVAHPQQIERRTSFSGGQMSEEASRKVANLLEHRRRSLTKLRGLVIPERPSTLEPILDLPEIKSRDSEQTNMSDYSTDSGVASGGSIGSNSNGASSATQPSATEPRAAKRIEIATRTAPATVSGNTSYRSIFNQQRVTTTLPTHRRDLESPSLSPSQPPQPPAKPPRTSLSTLSTASQVLGSVRPPALLPHDESDSDSVFSSKISSPPMSPMGASLNGSISSTNHATTNPVVPEKFALTRTLSSETNTSIASSTTSTLTSGSGSQASCSSVGSTPTVDLSRRIMKSTHTAANSNTNGEANAVAAAAAASRKNILASAKCRSGRGESSLLRQRSQAPYHDDEDSTDGYDEEEVRRVAHKTRSRSNLANGNAAANSFQGNVTSGMMLTHAPSKTTHTPHSHSHSIASAGAAPAAASTLVNYKLVSKNLATAAAANANSIVDRVINVAAYVEVTTTASDTDDSSHKSDAANATSPSKISAIFIDEERKASFKATTIDATSEFDIKMKVTPLTPYASASKAKIANAVPVKAVIAQQAATPLIPAAASPKTPVSIPVQPLKKKTPDVTSNGNGNAGSTELQQWVQFEMAKSTNRTATKSSIGNATRERSLKPVLAKFERGSSTSLGASTTTSAAGSIVGSKQLTKPTTSTAELRERFERSANAVALKVNPTKLSAATTGAASNSYLDRFSSLDSVASSSSGVSSSTQNVSSTHEHNDFGSFSSLGSNQSLITAQDLWQIMEEADPPLKHREAFIVVLQRDTPESTVGITLAGGADYETKEVTVNKVLAESPAARDGRLRKGDRILAVNGMSMRGLTHNESVSVLKTPRPEVTLVVTRSESLVVEAAPKKRYTLGSLTSLLEKPNTEQQPLDKKQRKSYHSASRSLDIGLDSVATTNEIENGKESNAAVNSNLALSASSSSSSSSTSTSTTSSTDGKKQDDATTPSTTLVAQERRVIVSKDYCGLGFSLEGGFDSPLGNRPLLIRKVFYGGAAHKTGQIKPGDEIIAINNISTAKMTRIEVWNYMNQLPMGDVEMVLL